MTTKISIYDSNHSVYPLKDIKIPENQEILDIQIRPDEIAIICKEVIDDKNTMTRIHLYKTEARVYHEVKLNA